MPFLTPVILELINDQDDFPWSVAEDIEHQCTLTGRRTVIPKGFKTDGSSVPEAIAAIPIVGQLMFMRMFNNGIFMGFREGVLHDFLRRNDSEGNTPVPALMAHKMFRAALMEANVPYDVVENYYAAVKAFNSSD